MAFIISRPNSACWNQASVARPQMGADEWPKRTLRGLSGDP